jgi:hypothetical protein
VIKLKIIGLTENILKGRDDYGNVVVEGTPILNTDFEGLSIVRYRDLNWNNLTKMQNGSEISFLTKG